MSTDTPETFESHDGSTDFDKRDVRALTEYIGVIPEGGDIYTVVGENENGEYQVDTRKGRCTCPDYQHNLADDETCKHIRRVKFATGEQAIPSWIDRDAVNELLGANVDGEPVYAASDGGSSTVEPQGTDSEKREKRPDDCSCLPTFEDLPCWPCYREGFKQPSDTE